MKIAEIFRKRETGLCSLCESCGMQWGWYGTAPADKMCFRTRCEWRVSNLSQ